MIVLRVRGGKKARIYLQGLIQKTPVKRWNAVGVIDNIEYHGTLTELAMGGLVFKPIPALTTTS